MQVPYNFQQVIADNQYQTVNGVKCFPVNMLDDNFSYLCKVVSVGSSYPEISFDGQFWFDGTILKISQSSSWKDIKVASAADADTVGGISPSQFLRSDQNTVCSGNITANTFISSVTTGTSPFVVSSTTMVSNLNADMVDGQHGAYYLARSNHTGTQTPNTISPQGSGSGLDADKLDGLDSSDFIFYSFFYGG
jgi:hypothetical protein